MTTSTDRRLFRETVALVAAKAKEKLPQAVNGRIESAARLVVNGDVEILEDGSIKVGGSDPTRWYHLVGSACTCTDYTQGKAPESWCKHRIAAGIHKRVQELLPPVVDPAPVAPLPEARASLNFRAMIGNYETQITLRSETEEDLLTRLQALITHPCVRPVPKPAPRSQGGWKKSSQGR